MAKRVLPKVKVRKRFYKNSVLVPSPHKPNFAGEEGAFLTGQVQGKKASQPEELFVTELERHPAVGGIEFRYTLGAPRGMPGWKEVDVLAEFMGVVYAFEVDTEFTHRGKKSSDQLHDAIVLNELQKQGMNIYPEVIHLNGERELADRENAKATVRRMFG